MESRKITLTNGCIWLGTQSDYGQFESDQWLVHTLENAPPPFTNSALEACIKLLRPWVRLVGILGGRFTPSVETTMLVIRVKVLESEGAGRAMNGMPQEFARSILDEAIAVLSDKNILGAGELSFERAWYHPIDSNRISFRILTRGLIRVLDSTWATAPDETIVELFHQAIREVREKSGSKKP